MGDVMRKLRRISCLVVVMLCCSLLAPMVDAASTFAADLELYRTNNKVTSAAARDLTAYVTAERLFARSLKKPTVQSRVLLRSYLSVLDQVDSSARRIVRDQRASDRVLADVDALASEKHIEAAWIVLKRAAAGQERFLTTITRTHLLVTKCQTLHAQLAQQGG
jgi:hypothetical protein